MNEPVKHPPIEGELIESGVTESFEYASYRVGNAVLHRLKAVGPIGIEERLPLYRHLAGLCTEGAFFAILDNHQRQPNSFTMDDMKRIADMLQAAGINAFYGATVTRDPHYGTIGKLANAQFLMNNLDGRVIVTGDPATAEKFMREMLDLHEEKIGTAQGTARRAGRGTAWGNDTGSAA